MTVGTSALRLVGACERRIIAFARRRCVPWALALASAFALAGCGRASGNGGGAGGGTSIAAAVIAFVAPRDGADAVIGDQLARFAQTARTRSVDDCMTNDGFAAPPLPTGGPPNDLGNPQFPNLPAIESSHNLGLFTGGPGVFIDPQGGMGAAERRAWQARISHCFRAMERQDLFFRSAKFGQLSSGWFNIVNQVNGSARIRGLSKAASKCSAAHGVPATSVMSLYGRLQQQLGPLSSSSTGSAKVQALQAKGANVLATCWAKVIDETTALLSARQTVFLAQYASEVAALESQVNGQVTSLERQYGLKLTLSGS